MPTTGSSAGRLLSHPVLAMPSAFLSVAALGAALVSLRVQRACRRRARDRAAGSRAEAGWRSTGVTPQHPADPRAAQMQTLIDDLESFNRTVAHDLRGPLGGMAALAGVARDSLLRADYVAVESHLRMIQAQASKCERLVGALMALAGAGDKTLVIERVDTAAVVREALEDLKIAHPGAALPVRVGALPEVEADPELARQVFVNLLGNALKFSARSPHPQVEVGSTGTAEHPIIFVRDNGTGFSAQDAQRLFHPFNRLHGNRYEGFGVGLSIVKRIIDRHGGMVWAQGEPGLGATFFFTFRP